MIGKKRCYRIILKCYDPKEDEWELLRCDVRACGPIHALEIFESYRDEYPIYEIDNILVRHRKEHVLTPWLPE